MNKFLSCFEDCIKDCYAVKGKAAKSLVAPKEGIHITIKSTGQYLLYEFDKTQTTDIFPYFKNVTKLKAKADYVILKVKGNKIYALVIELKQKNGDPKPQIQATKHFVEYLIKNISRVMKSDHNYYLKKLELRGIEYSKLRKISTSPEVKYNKFNNTTLTGKTLYLELYLK